MALKVVQLNKLSGCSVDRNDAGDKIVKTLPLGETDSWPDLEGTP